MTIDTQGMSYPSKVPTGQKPVEYPPMPVKRIPVYSDMEVKALKKIIHEVLDERERRYEEESTEWLHRGTY